MIRPDLRATLRVVAVLPLTLACWIWIGLAGGCPMSDWYARRLPPRSYRQVSLAAVIQDLEVHGVIPVGTVWEADSLKSIPVTQELWLFPTDKEAVRLIAEQTGVVMAYPMDTHGGILGPIHIRESAGTPPGVQSMKVNRWEGPTYAADRLPTPRP